MTTFALVAAVVAEIEHVIFGPNVGREPSIRETAPGRDGNATFNTRLAAFALSDLDRTAGQRPDRPIAFASAASRRIKPKLRA